MQNILQKPLLVLAIILISVFIYGSDFSLAQTFDSDFESLKSRIPFHAAAYDRVKIFDAWDKIRESLSNNQLLELSLINIGIIDSGIDGGHPEFSSFVDFGTTPSFTKFDSVREGHGTQVTGIIGANNITGQGINLPLDSPQMNGILSGVSELPYVLEVRKGVLFERLGRIPNAFSVARRVDDLIEQGVDVINLSAGGNDWKISRMIAGSTFYFQKTFTNESARDVLFVMGAGNSNVNANLVSPANLGDELENVIVVGGVRQFDLRSDFSNFGSSVNIAAPGEDIYTPVPRGQGNLPELEPDKDYSDEFVGTSFSAPFVTGVAGLLKAINPELTPAELKQILVETADPIQTGEPDKRLGMGCYSDPNNQTNTGCRLNAHTAVCHPLALNCQEGPPQEEKDNTFSCRYMGNNVCATSNEPEFDQCQELYKPDESVCESFWGRSWACVNTSQNSTCIPDCEYYGDTSSGGQAGVQCVADCQCQSANCSTEGVCL